MTEARPRESSPPLCATPAPGWSDDIVIERGADGSLRYLRADDPARESYGYHKPFILELELTRRCNLHCVHCYARAEREPPQDELAFGEIRDVLAAGQRLGIRELSLTGGEVMLHERFLDVIDAGLEADYGVRFVTNGTLLDDGLFAALCRRPLRLITVSLDGISAESHERIRGPGNHGAVLAAIERLQRAGFAISIITAFSRLNIGEFDGLLAFCTERGIDWQVQMTSAKGRCPRDITFSPDEYYALGEKVAHAMATAPPIHVVPMDDLATYSHFAPLSALGQTWKQQCVGGILNIFVRANGDVTPCSALAFDECVVGNVRRESLERICREQRCRAALGWLSAEALTGACRACPFKDACRGGCPEILLSMCQRRTENQYCYHRIEQQRIVAEVLGDG